MFHSTIRIPRAIPSGPTRTSAKTTPFSRVEAGVRPATGDGNCRRITSIAPEQLSSSQYIRPVNPAGIELSTLAGEMVGRLRLAAYRFGFELFGLVLRE